MLLRNFLDGNALAKQATCPAEQWVYSNRTIIRRGTGPGWTCGLAVARIIAAMATAMATATATSTMSTNSTPPGLRAAGDAAVVAVITAGSPQGRPKHHRNLSRLVVAHYLLEPEIPPTIIGHHHLN